MRPWGGSPPDNHGHTWVRNFFPQSAGIFLLLQGYWFSMCEARCMPDGCLEDTILWMEILFRLNLSIPGMFPSISIIYQRLFENSQKDSFRDFFWTFAGGLSRDFLRILYVQCYVFMFVQDFPRGFLKKFLQRIHQAFNWKSYRHSSRDCSKDFPGNPTEISGEIPKEILEESLKESLRDCCRISTRKFH